MHQDRVASDRAGSAFKILMDTLGLSHRALADKLHIAHSAVTQALALLRLPEEVQETVDSGALAPSAAYEVAKLDDPAEQAVLAGRVVAENLTRAAVISAVRERKARTPRHTEPKSTSEPAPEPRFTSATGCGNQVTAVEITLGRGRVVLVSGVPAGAGPEETLEILYQAIDKLKAEIASTV